MKKELLIVILVVIAIIGISVLLKYVIFRNYSSNQARNICSNLCGKEKLLTSRCGYNNCSSKEKIITPTGDNVEKIKEFCDSKFETKPTIPGAWVCCCK